METKELTSEALEDKTVDPTELTSKGTTIETIDLISQGTTVQVTKLSSGDSTMGISVTVYHHFMVVTEVK